MDSVLQIAKRAREASYNLATRPAEMKNLALKRIAEVLVERADHVISQNAIDLEHAKNKGLSKAMLERLALSHEKIQDIAKGVYEVCDLHDPVGEIMESAVRPNGLKIEKVRTPIGVIGIIYESRPNVTIDCAALCLKSGNACILRGGSEAFNTNMALAEVIAIALKGSGMDEACVQIIPTADRSALNELLKLDQYVDCIIPRGGEGLIRFVVENSTIPVVKHYKGVCTVYVDKFANPVTADILTVDSKTQRPSVCNAAENLIVHADIAEKFLPQIAKLLAERGVELRASERAGAILKRSGIEFVKAAEEDFSTEYIDLIIAIDIVGSVDDAIAFINKYGSHHSDLIVTEAREPAEKFLNGVDSATVYWNASTRFTDGFEFGFGAEIGISTDKLHARGPMGLKELCSYKYKIRGDGQTKGKPIM